MDDQKAPRRPLNRRGAAVSPKARKKNLRSRKLRTLDRVEAVRHALFVSANKLADGGSTKKLGNGVLQAARALATAPPNKRVLQKMPQDSAAFPFLHAFTGLGVAQPTASDRMLALEATQLSQQWPRTDVPNPFDAAVPDPDIPSEAISVGQRRAYLRRC
jgi:hypothetical protein